MSVPMKLKDVSFVDLYLSERFLEVKGLSGCEVAVEQQPVPDYLADDAKLLFDNCKKAQEAKKRTEFSLIYDDVFYRVSVIEDLNLERIYVCRRSTASIRPLMTLGLSKMLLTTLSSPHAKGLFLVAGEMASGKTTTAASIISHRLQTLGGLAIAIEDPPETQLNGSHGEAGRCIQVEVSESGYPEQLFKAMRSGANMILIGEIRTQETAREVIKAGLNGHFVIATIHAGSIQQAIERLNAIAGMPNGYVSISSGLAQVIFQRRDINTSGKNVSSRVFIHGLDMITADNAQSVRSKIKDGRLSEISGEIDSQIRQAQWAGKISS